MTTAFQHDHPKAGDVGKILRVRGERHRSLFRRTRLQQLQTETDFSEVDRGQVDRPLLRNRVSICGEQRPALTIDPKTGVDQPTHGFRNSATRPLRLFRLEAVAADSASAVGSSIVRYKSPKTLRAS